MANPLDVTRRIEEVSGIRPVTLLIASGIALIIVILMVTGIAANHLREQALGLAEKDLARVDGVLAEALKRSLVATDARLDEVGVPLSTAALGLRTAAGSPHSADALNRALARIPRLDGAAVIALDGTVLNRAGTWPEGDELSHRLMAALSHSPPGQTDTLAGAIKDPRTGAISIPLGRRLDRPGAEPGAEPLGAIAALIPLTDFTTLFAAAPLTADTEIALLGADGTVVARHPDNPGVPLPSGKTKILEGVTSTIIRHFTGSDGAWRIEAVRAVAPYPAALSVSRSAQKVLAEWAHQGLWFAGFALILSLTIALMVYLVARQFQTHAAIAAMRADRIEAEKVEAERARLAAEAELLKKERLSVLGQLTATVAHELRNPLSAIRNTLFTLKEMAAGAGIKLERPLSRMERSIERCDRIISDLLEYTRHRELKRTTVRFDRWIGDILAEQSLAPGVEVAAELRAAEETLTLDPDRFRRVVINLIENAAQALADNEPERERRISVRTALAERDLILVVADTGPGIKPENLEKIFEPLFSTKTFGTGLGLPTVKQIVNQHGGTITVESEIGSGTSVTVRLPRMAEPEEVLRAAA